MTVLPWDLREAIDSAVLSKRSSPTTSNAEVSPGV
jgi:hypothetical protein